MTYEQYLVNVMGLSPEVARYADPILAAAIGLGADVLSAYSAYQISLPGFQGFAPPSSTPRSFKLSQMRTDSFPGGNDGISRHFVKALVPEAITGAARFEDVLNGRVNFDALDRRDAPTRIRVGATVVRVEHEAPGKLDGDVRVTYVKDGKPYIVTARGVVMATGGWSAKHVVRDLPAAYTEAFGHFPRSPMLVVNVALNNWRFLHDLGFTAASWSGGFGFSGNLRPNMIVGDYAPPLDPAKPNLFTLYVPFNKAGMPLVAQGNAGRAELLSTSYADYERAIRRQMVHLFGAAGFDAKRDIAGVVLNRWGHAYVNPAPGFYFGRNGASAPRDIIRRAHGRIAFAHSELNGHQNWVAAVSEGRRAAEQMAGSA
jgi:spermidine dehydrogenase